MNVKTAIQLLIFFLILIFIYFFVKNTFLKEQKNIVNLDLNKDEVIKEIKTGKDQSNIIENLNYISIDAKGNKYILNAEYGEESTENSNIIILKQVVGTIKLIDKSYIKIKSDFAKYNSITLDTNFYGNVFGFFEDSKISSDNLDLYFKNNKATMYNNIQYLDKNTAVNADEISFNLLNGDVNVKMFDKNKKVKIIKN
jgi:lipopolysaccharide assembly outer membrane protein LptD (OstA)